MYRKLGLLLASSALAGLTACAQLPHNNVLLFGTDTKLAFDISSSATSGGAPQLTIGYRRAEAAWVPLVANTRICKDGNQEECEVITASEDGRAQALVAQDVEEGKGKDALSVFASFGATFSGDAGPAAEGVSASGGLAQFFATGIAAQRVAKSGELSAILKVSNEAEAKAQAAKAVANADARLAELKQEIGKEGFEALESEQTKKNKEATDESNLILSKCGGPDSGSSNWSQKIEKAKEKGLSDIGIILLKGSKNNEEAKNFFVVNEEFRPPFLLNIGFVCS